MTTTKKMWIGLGVLFLIIVCFCFLYPHKASQEKNPADMPTIVVGCDNYAPFNYRDLDGNIKGIDVDLAKEAFHRLGYNPKFIFINWETKNFLLQDRKIDCIWSCYTMNGRESKYNWAGPYMKSRQVVAVTPDSDIQKLSDLEGKVLALQSTTKPEDILRTHPDNLPHFRRILSYRHRDLIFTAVSKGYADALAAHDTSIEQFTQDFGVEYRILEEPLLETGLGVAFDKNDDRGINVQLQKVLKDMQQDGTTEKIIGKYLPHAEKYLED